MKEGDVILVRMAQSDGEIKNRPAVFLRKMPAFHDVLVCGISTQLHQFVPDFDELLTNNDSDFVSSGLIRDSLIRLGYLAVVPGRRIPGSIGAISADRYHRLLHRLSQYPVSET